MPRIAEERKGPAQPMRIHLYAACWNERRALDFFVRHQDPIVVDHCSNMATAWAERLQQNPRVTLQRLKHIDPTSIPSPCGILRPILEAPALAA